MTPLGQAQHLLSKLPCDSFLVTDPIDLFYLLGIEFSLGALWFSKEKALLFVDGRYQEVAADAKGVRLEQWTELENFVGALKDPCGFDKDHLTYGNYLNLSAKQKEFLPLVSPIKELRQRKSPEEIEKIKIAAALCQRGMHHVMETLSLGMSESEVAEELDRFWKKEGGQRFSFEPIIAFGAHSSKPHYRSSKQRLQRGDIVLVDIGVVVDHYHSDMTRVFGFGPIPEELQVIYKIVYEAKQQAIAGCKAGRSVEEIDSLARDWITKKGYGEKFVHSLGHGIGLQTHENPFLRKKGAGILAENMIVTIEPGIYLPNIGGVRIEDMVLIKEKVSENLTPQFDYSEILIL